MLYVHYVYDVALLFPTQVEHVTWKMFSMNITIIASEGNSNDIQTGEIAFFFA